LAILSAFALASAASCSALAFFSAANLALSFLAISLALFS